LAWDVEIEIPSPITEVYNALLNWHRSEELLKLASVSEYHVLRSDDRNEYYWLKVRDLPFKSSFCYGRRLLRRPDIILNIFTYRFLRSRKLSDPGALERYLRTDIDHFFYNTARLSALESGSTLLKVNEPGGDFAARSSLNEIRAFYIRLGQLAAGFEQTIEEEPEATEDGGIGQQDFTFHPDDSRYDPYAVLGVDRNDSFELIKRSYRRLAMKWHPDRMAGAGAARIRYAHNRFIEITAAYHSILRSRDL